MNWLGALGEYFPERLSDGGFVDKLKIVCGGGDVATKIEVVKDIMDNYEKSFWAHIHLENELKHLERLNEEL